MSAIIVQSLMDTWRIVPRVLIIMFVSLFITGLFIELDLFKRIEFIGRPLAKLSHLPNESAITFVTSFGSVLAGNTMLAQLYREKIMDKRETFLTALLNGVPVYIKESFTYQIPIIIPALGIKVGSIYFLSFLLSGIARLIFVISWGKIKLVKPVRYERLSNEVNYDKDKRNKRPKFSKAMTIALRTQKKTFLRVCLVFVPMTFLMLLLINIGLAERVQGYVQPLTRLFRLPSVTAVPVTTYMFSPLVGATSVGTLIRDGGITESQAVVASLLGGLLMLPVFTLRYSLAKYTAIFGGSLGAQILLVSLGIGMLVRGTVLLIFLRMI
ncbi:MAG: nucleoside recognition protein [Candidatus Omnitrophica bacterium]|nr:nucleoside recognition protein [Candidatus Omnitrophota bacterium]